MTKALANIFRTTQLPAVLCVASGDTESDDTVTISKVNDNTSGSNVTILTNVAEAKSPITGTAIDKSNTPNVEEASLNRKETLAAFVCVANCLSCNHDSYVSPELAEKLDTKDFFCANCGEQVTAMYDGDFEDTSADDLAEDDEEDINDALEEVDEPDSEGEDTPDEEVEDTEDNMEGDEGSDTEDEPEEVEDTEEVEPADDAEVDDVVVEEPVEEDVTEEDAKTAEVTVASVADYSGDLQFAMLSDTSKYEVFLGSNHIGSLLKDEAAESVQNAFAKHDLVRNAFGKVFWQNSASIGKGDFSSLTDFGFKPAKISVELSNVVASEIKAAEEENAAKLADAIKEAQDSVIATMTVAAAGINKGVLSGTNLYSEISKLLSRHGVQLADEAAARFVEEFAVPYFNSVVTAATELRAESPDYVRGLAKSIETASYKKSASDADPSLLTSALNLRSEPVRKPVVDTSSFKEPAKKTEFYSVFNRFSR